MSGECARAVAGDIYGGDFRGNPELARPRSSSTRAGSRACATTAARGRLGWTSSHWLHRPCQPTLTMAGSADLLVPAANVPMPITCFLDAVEWSESRPGGLWGVAERGLRRSTS